MDFPRQVGRESFEQEKELTGSQFLPGSRKATVCDFVEFLVRLGMQKTVVTAEKENDEIRIDPLP
ncbi:MAG: hypothetical protein ACYTG7_10660 [Planctomycetota bacterium]|jgi:hypothetical protein